MQSILLKTVMAAFMALSLSLLVHAPESSAKRNKYKYGQRYKKRHKRNVRASTCVPCAGRNRQCEKPSSDLHCKACNAYREAFSDYAKYRRRDPKVAWAALVEVNRTVIARSESGIYPRDICAAIHQPYQFSWTLCPKTCVSDRDWAIVMRAAEDAKTSNGKMNYHAAYVSPAWSRQCRGRNRIGTHIYYDNCTGGRIPGQRRNRRTTPAAEPRNFWKTLFSPRTTN